jgi:hypothetical protein
VKHTFTMFEHVVIDGQAMDIKRDSVVIPSLLKKCEEAESSEKLKDRRKIFFPLNFSGFCSLKIVGKDGN